MVKLYVNRLANSVLPFYHAKENFSSLIYYLSCCSPGWDFTVFFPLKLILLLSESNFPLSVTTKVLYSKPDGINLYLQIGVFLYLHVQLSVSLQWSRSFACLLCILLFSWVLSNLWETVRTAIQPHLTISHVNTAESHYLFPFFRGL